MLFDRTIKEKVENSLKEKQKVVILYGPRQAGKTTLIKAIISNFKNEPPYYTGDDLYTQELFGKNELEILKRTVGEEKLLIIDEAQRIPNIGLSLKLLVDNLPITILVSGSSSFDIANRINEPLTGRTSTFQLFPLSYKELKKNFQMMSPESALEEMLRFGMYPKIHTLASEEEKQNYLYELLNNYLYKDILTFENVRKPKKAVDLLALLALQIGKEVSVSELAQNLSISQKSVENYLDVLEKMFVVVNLRGFSRNLRKEISKTSKYYFADIGLRNALIRNFNPLRLRSDYGELFENWLVVEKMKRANNEQTHANFYFWRTYDQKEIDLVEERDGKLFGYEFKWSAKKTKPPADWLKTYTEAGYEVIDRENYQKFLTKGVSSKNLLPGRQAIDRSE
ncbi:MAG: ATP-binding protein [Patescibacteria group bacterium]|nr:ATP-binding protein [Patescibacteria group bacterium]